ncbi:expressed unknown protein [Seminavis robusta]|uniref:Fungal lipase-type domain-containing protein n=1 Tax=Seminavis robusta TaxID=568900 RepID=A0A9N8EUZ2_9STRA|nr:expressed unknown protein [Seminavis robusta]|eukprot:Sro1839_g300920.1 n/a (471) ;mRNA; f:13861-15710
MKRILRTALLIVAIVALMGNTVLQGIDLPKDERVLERVLDDSHLTTGTTTRVGMKTTSTTTTSSSSNKRRKLKYDPYNEDSYQPNQIPPGAKENDHYKQQSSSTPYPSQAPSEIPSMAPSPYIYQRPPPSSNPTVVDNGYHRPPSPAPTVHYGYHRPPTTTTPAPVPDHCPAYPDLVFLMIPKNMMLKLQEIMKLAKLVSREESGPIGDLIEEQRLVYDFFDGWTDPDDQAVVAKTKDRPICYAVFEATQEGNLGDQLQNLNPLSKEVEGSDCTVRAGYYDAYKAEYYDDFRQSVEDCIRTCYDEFQRPCPLVVGGDSQGGAAAVVASIDLAHHNPQVITTGAPRTIVNTSPCKTIDETRHSRFLNTGRHEYDYVPFQPDILNTRHVGHTFFLDDGVNWPVATPGFNNNEPRLFLSRDLHERPVYEERIQAMIDRDCFPIPVGKWPGGHYCTQDDECESGDCSNGACTNV